MPDDTRPRVVKLKLTCPSCPTQWEGELEDGRFIYVRYRYGALWVGLGDSEDDAVRNSGSADALFCKKIGNVFDGGLDYPKLVSLLRDHLVLPDESEVENDW